MFSRLSPLTLTSTCIVRRQLLPSSRTAIPLHQLPRCHSQSTSFPRTTPEPVPRRTIHTTATMSFETKATIPCYGGKFLKLSHESSTTGTPMAVNIYLPPAAAHEGKQVPVLIYLSGLTCTPENCTDKGFLQATASKHNIALVLPDTSPRGLSIPGEDDSWDFGSGAGFYINATTEPWSKNYKMEDYITKELPKAIFAAYSKELDSSRVSITGHSMGGHGALTLYLKNPGMYKSVSAFSAICNPTQAPWGEKAFTGYFGAENKDEWKKHDATELLKQYKGDKSKLDILIDVGTGDNFYKQKQLLPENFEAAAKEIGAEKGVNVRYQPDYDHSYYFISSFGADHVEHAAKHLNGTTGSKI